VLLATFRSCACGSGYPRSCSNGEASYSETVARAEQGLAEPELVIEHGTRRIACHGAVIGLPPCRLRSMPGLRGGESSARHGRQRGNALDAGRFAELVAEYAASGNLPRGGLEEQSKGLPTESR